MTRAILFDLGKVIVHFDFAIGYRALEALCGIPADELRDRIRATGLVPRYETGLIESEPFYLQLIEAIGIDVSYPDFCRAWNSIFSRDTLVPDDFLRALHSRYPLLLVSNTNQIHFEMILMEYPFLRHFDHCVLSYEVRSMKPAPGIFQKAIGLAGAAPGECFFTDDLHENVDAARTLGIDAAPFLGFDQLKRDLAERGVAW